MSSANRILQQRMWTWMRAARGKFWWTRQDVEALFGGSSRRYVQALYRAAYLEREVRGNPHTPCYRLVKDTGALAPRTRAGGALFDPNLAGLVQDPQQRIWNALRILRAATARDLAAKAGVSLSVAQSYCSVLAANGYLGQASRLAPWVLTKDTGPAAPIVLTQSKALFDQNLNTFQSEGA